MAWRGDIFPATTQPSSSCVYSAALGESLPARGCRLSKQPSDREKSMFQAKRAALTCAIAVLLSFSGTSIAQEPTLFLTGTASGSPQSIAEDYLKGDGAARFGLQASDLEYVLEESTYRSEHTGVSHVFFNQFVHGVPVYRGVVQINVMPDGRVLNASSHFQPDALQRANAPVPTLSAADAVRAAARDMGYSAFQPAALPARAGDDDRQAFAGGVLSAEDIKARLVYEPHQGELRLAWQFVVDRFERESKLLDLRYDAATGELLGSDNYVHELDDKHPRHASAGVKAAGHGVVYRVSPLGQESPAHPGVGHALVSDPHVENASPYGWHDRRANPTAGQPQYLVTHGNNARAQWDLQGTNVNSDSARPLGVWNAGSNTLSFDFPWVESQAPDSTTNRVASTVNLFYWNNIIHDVLYQYGFDEASGNFQFTNYTGAPGANDGVIADALDGSQAATPSVNNANFSTPTDGGSGRMQMFRWTSPSGLRVLQPYQTDYAALVGGFGGALVPNQTGQLLPANDGSANPDTAVQGCGTTWANAAQMAGKVALIQRGVCEFGVKALNAQNAGAIAVVIYNNANDEPISMGGGVSGGSVTIPVISIGQSQGDALRDAAQTDTVQVQFLGTLLADRDSDFDAGIIAHEYGHGVSYRLTGGRTTNCLAGDEQQGEGWSDFFALMFTMTDDVCTLPRGVGTYSTFQAPTGPGIRNYPYSPDMNVNPFTFASIADPALSVPHGVGSVWNTMLWDMSCKLMDRYGYEPDIYSRGGGNGMAMQLVVDGLKLQGCYPQFVKSRDAIIAADAALAAVPGTDYLTNRCIIWHAFARRGVGQGASSGSYTSRTDQTTSTTVPADCMSFNVTASAGTGGSISPAGSQTAAFEDVLSFQITPQPGFVIASVEGCEGVLIDDEFVTLPIVRACSVTATFEADGGPVNHAVTPVVVGNGSIDPATVQHVPHGQTTSFVLAAAAHHHLVDATGCGGAVANDLYTTAAITGDCTVTATFAIDRHVISTVVGAGGNIAPAGPFNADHGSQPAIVLTPNAGFAVASASGCGGNLSGNTYTLAPVSADCTVEVMFELVEPAIFSDGFESLD